jgi:hypothetical protein
VLAKVEWHPGELYARDGFIGTNLLAAGGAHRGLLQPPRHGGATDQRRKGRDQMDAAGCLAANAVRLQLHVLAYNLGNFMRTLAMPKTVEQW